MHSSLHRDFTTFSMVSVLIGAVCNIVFRPCILSFVFSYGEYAVLHWQLLSHRRFSTLWGSFHFLCGKKDTASPQEKSISTWRQKVVLPLYRAGDLLLFIMQSSESIVTVCFNSSLLRYGGDIAVGAMTILTVLCSFAHASSSGNCAGSTANFPVYNYGAKNADRVKKNIPFCF